MKKLVKIAFLVVLFAVALFAAAAAYVDNLDADAYRPRLARFLADKTGRAVKLNGPIAFALTLHGLDVTIQDAAFGNPAWASRPYMAGMGKFQLSLKLLPLLSHQVQIERLAIENADILLETGKAGQHNWDFKTPAPAAQTPQATAQPRGTDTAAAQDSLVIDTLTVVNSQIALRDADGHTDSINVGSFALGMTGKKAVIDFKGDDNGHPVTLSVRTGITDLLAIDRFPFDGSASYDAIALTAKGDADLQDRLAKLNSYQVTAAQTKLTGTATLSWGGARPAVNGTLDSARFDPADFTDAQDADTEAAPGTAPTAATRHRPAPRPVETRLFSDAPLPLGLLRVIDANLTISIGEMPVGRTALRQVDAHLALSNGNLDLAPVKAMLGAAPLELQVKLDAGASPPHLTLGVIGSNVDLGELQKLANMTNFMSGQAGANIQVAGSGDTPHAIASSLGGVVTISATHGAVSGGAAAGVSQALAKIFNPQGNGDTALTCLVARFVVRGGVMTSNGILIDTAPSVVAGKGTVNLGSETVDLVLRAKTKLYDVGGLLPAVSVTGDLRHPAYNVDAQAVVQNVVGQLLAGHVDVASSGVPAIEGAPAGQNACVYTLDHPVAAATGAGVLPAGIGGKAGQQIQQIGNSLIKGIFGK